MEQPEVPSPAEGAPPSEAQPRKAVDPAQIKSMLNLPETASDLELITALVELIAELRQKYEALLSDAVALEDKVANRDLEDFKDVILPASSDFWRGQLLANRDQALAVLAGIREGRAVITPPAPPPRREPLRNRLLDAPKSVTELSEGVNPADNVRAVAIRNRAHELRKTENLPWSDAFARAEKEYTK